MHNYIVWLCRPFTRFVSFRSVPFLFPIPRSGFYNFAKPVLIRIVQRINLSSWPLTSCLAHHFRILINCIPNVTFARPFLPRVVPAFSIAIRESISGFCPAGIRDILMEKGGCWSGTLIVKSERKTMSVSYNAKSNMLAWPLNYTIMA